MKARLPKGMGGGAQNMNAMIRQAQQMQEDMTNLQEELDAKEYEISAGGGVVTIKINGKKEVLSLDRIANRALKCCPVLKKNYLCCWGNCNTHT